MNRAWLVDTAERVAATFVEAGCGSAILAGAHVLSLSALHAAAVAGVSAGLTVLKTALAGATTTANPPAGFAPVPAPPRPTGPLPQGEPAA